MFLIEPIFSLYWTIQAYRGYPLCSAIELSPADESYGQSLGHMDNETVIINEDTSSDSPLDIKTIPGSDKTDAKSPVVEPEEEENEWGYPLPEYTMCVGGSQAEFGPEGSVVAFGNDPTRLFFFLFNAIPNATMTLVFTTWLIGKAF